MTTQADLVEAAVTDICRAVAELPDRTSPDDWPEAMLVTADELAKIVRAALATTDRVRSESFRQFAWETIYNIGGVVETLMICERRALEHLSMIHGMAPPNAGEDGGA